MSMILAILKISIMVPLFIHQLFDFFCVVLKVYMLMVSLNIKSSYIVQLYKSKLIIYFKKYEKCTKFIKLIRRKKF